ncbi:uncharacterized protein CLUP02_10833 [Colletotrichum lupini]|uniref:Uncharacterized protein n=1 Tax=Colletotrichum lupini TaxID=145971 RepID=A0A9Q8SXG8_9PEZI|nr:uncharacterized protein CLUP02_10833 [Colletotrichum lupini]UQC85336.1 hypothetical protein CLUP02_10833 [Colletotrichum lupini]
MLVFVPSGMLISNGPLPNRRKGNETRLITSRRQTGIVLVLVYRKTLYICPEGKRSESAPRLVVSSRLYPFSQPPGAMHEPNSNGVGRSHLPQQAYYLGMVERPLCATSQLSQVPKYGWQYVRHINVISISTGKLCNKVPP